MQILCVGWRSVTRTQMKTNDPTVMLCDFCHDDSYTGAVLVNAHYGGTCGVCVPCLQQLLGLTKRHIYAAILTDFTSSTRH